jgi:hypothetical protein
METGGTVTEMVLLADKESVVEAGRENFGEVKPDDVQVLTVTFVPEVILGILAKSTEVVEEFVS